MSNSFQHNRDYLIFCIGCILLILVTNNFASLDEIISNGVTDAKSYLLFFTSDIYTNKDFFISQSHHIDRWPIYLAAQKISSTLPFEWELTSRLISIIILAIIFYLIYSLKFNLYIKIIISLFIAFSPYSFRFYLYAPIALSDLFFFFSSFLFFVGIKKENILLGSSGVVLGILSKQTAFLLLPILFIFLTFKLINLQKLLYFLTLFFITFALKKFFEFQIFGQLIDPPDLVHLIGFLNYFDDSYILFKSIVGIVLLIMLVSPLLIFSNYISKKNFYIFLSIFLIFSSQPILGASGGNMARLITFAYPAIIFLFSDSQKPSTREIFIFSSLIIFLSFHHNYSLVHDSRYLFGSIIFISTIISLTYLKFKRTNISI